MLDPKLLLARSITLLYREANLKSQGDTSLEMVKEIVKDIVVGDNSIGISEDKKIITSLKKTAAWMCENTTDGFNKKDLMQEIKIACESDTNLFSAFEEALDANYSEEELKKSVLTLRKQLSDHFREKKISEMFRKASADINFNRDKIENLSTYVQEFLTSVEPYSYENKIKDPAVLASIDFGNKEEVRKTYSLLRKEAGVTRVYKTGFKGLNEMFDGGLHAKETSMNLSLPHNYKTGLSLTLFSQVLRYNIPKTQDPKKIPCMVRISFEDELEENLKFLFIQMRYTETREFVKIEDYDEDFITEYVSSRLEANGWRVFMKRVDPTQWTYKDITNYVVDLESQGFSVEGLWLDYMGLVPTTGCIQGNAGEALRDMLRRLRNFAAARGALFHTPHQLSTEAKGLLRGITTPAMFVKDVAEKGYAAGSKQLDHELDLEFYHHKFQHGKDWYLGIQRGKHRSHMIFDEKKFCILPFPSNLMPIPDDINDDSPILRRVGAASQTNKEDEDLLIL